MVQPVPLAAKGIPVTILTPLPRNNSVSAAITLQFLQFCSPAAAAIALKNSAKTLQVLQ
jgi:hypothetical protein